MSRLKALLLSMGFAAIGTAVVIAVHDTVADVIGGAVALGALVVATRAGIQLAGESGGLGDDRSPVDLGPRRRGGAPRRRRPEEPRP